MPAIAKRKFARGALDISEVGLGTAPFGGMYRAVDSNDALDAVRAAWKAGMRYFDSAPMYGLGRCEHLLGHGLREIEESTGNSDWIISTKVGRLVRNARPGAPLPPAPPKNEFDTGWASGLRFTEVFDYSYDAVMRSYEDSQQRLGLDRIDILFIHDIGRVTHGALHDKHWGDLTKGGGFRALGELRDQGYIKGVGLGVNEWEVIRDAMGEFDIDCCMLAGRYTLLDQSSLAQFMPLCVERKVSVVAAGVFNSGILVSNDMKFNYVDAPPEIVERATRLKQLATDHNVPLPAVAMKFSLSHPAVGAIALGARTGREVEEIAGWYHFDIPAGFWSDLRASGLIDATAPLPA